jgi:hypothetical protein
VGLPLRLTTKGSTAEGFAPRVYHQGFITEGLPLRVHRCVVTPSGCKTAPQDSQIQSVGSAVPGSFNCSLPVPFGESCSFTCSSGFPLEASEPICSPEGTWDYTAGGGGGGGGGAPVCLECRNNGDCPCNDCALDGRCNC